MLSFERTREIFSGKGLDLTEGQYERLSEYARLLLEWNERINLTAITDDEGVAVKHFFDSVYPFTLTEVPEGARVIDVGTGAGFPSCPLKIFREDIELTLLDSLNKRVNFLRELSNTLGLGARCIHGRAEEQGRSPELRESFDIATARAVANLTELCEYCLPFVRVGGRFLALKGSGGRDELAQAENAVSILGGRVTQTEDYELPGGDGRTLIVIEKLRPTPPKYPRNAGQMKKKRL